MKNAMYDRSGVASLLLKSSNGEMEFADKVTARLQAIGRSQNDMAGILGTTQQQVSRWVTENKPPTSKYLLQMARYLGVTVDYLLDSKIEEPHAQSPGVTEDERAVLIVYNALRLSRDEAVRRLSGLAPDTAEESGVPLPGVAPDRSFRE